METMWVVASRKGKADRVITGWSKMYKPSVASFTTEVNPRLAKRPLKSMGV